MRQALTDTFLRTVKQPIAGRVEIADLRCAGLTFRLTASGARSWCFRFRDPITRRPLRATIGTFPAIGLQAARAAADELRRQVAAGANPIETKRRRREEANTNTFGALAERFMREHAWRHKRPRSAQEDARNLRVHVLPAWGGRPFQNIARKDVIELVENIVATGTPIAANRVQALVSAIFSFAVDADLLAANPCTRLRRRGAETVRTRTLSDDELRKFWHLTASRQAGRDAPLTPVFGMALRLCLLTGLRVSEVAELSIHEIERLHDPDGAVIVFPGTRTKNGRDHLIPLSRLARDAISEALALAGDDATHVFIHRGVAITGHGLSAAMGRLSARAGWSTPMPTAHDLRRTCATRLAGLGVPGEDVAAVLNHTRSDVTGRHYDQYARAREKRSALNAWDAALLKILKPGKGGDIVSIRSWA